MLLFNPEEIVTDGSQTPSSLDFFTTIVTESTDILLKKINFFSQTCKNGENYCIISMTANEKKFISS